MSRFTRQIRLADVGENGQAKLSAARVALRTQGFAQSVEEAYLRAAGVSVLGPFMSGAEAGAGGGGAASLGLRHAAAREVAEGAYAALVAMREILGVGRGHEAPAMKDGGS